MRYLKQMIDLALLFGIVILALTALPPLFGISVYAVASRSMEPALLVGSAVYVVPEEFENIRTGDIITFRIGGSASATHRVVEKEEESRTFVTQGDANDQPDGKHIGYADVLGVVRLSIPYLGYLAVILGRAEGKLLCTGLILWLLLLDGIVSGRNLIRIRERRSYYEH